MSNSRIIPDVILQKAAQCGWSDPFVAMEIFIQTQIICDENTSDKREDV